MQGWKDPSFNLGIFLIVVLDLIWVLSSEITEYILSIKHYNKPFFITYVNSAFLSLGLIFNLIRCRRSFHKPSCEDVTQEDFVGSELEKVRLVSHTDTDKFDDEKVVIRGMSESDGLVQVKMDTDEKLTWTIVKIAPIFALLFFCQNYSYNMALSKTAPSIVNVVSSASGLFVLLFGSLIPRVNHSAPDEQGSVESFTFFKLFFASLTIVGVAVITVSDIAFTKSTKMADVIVANRSTQVDVSNPTLTELAAVSEPVVPWGVVWALMGALFYALYSTLFTRYNIYVQGGKLSLFLGSMGLWCTLMTTPLIPILNSSGVELFELPHTPSEWAILLTTGILGCLVTNYIYLQASLLTSPLVVTLGMTLSIPITIVYDVIISRSHFPAVFFLGTVPVLVSFVGIAIVS